MTPPGADTRHNDGPPTRQRPRLPTTRRVPRQERSRRRVEAILDAASRLVLARGVDAVTTRAIADEAAIPVASVYQYFTDRDAVLLALVERDMAEMDDQLVADLAALEAPTAAGLVETAMRAFVTVYARRPAFVEVWLRGRANPAVERRGREHNAAVATMLHAYATGAGLVAEDVSPTVALLAVEVGDRIFQLAYEHDLAGDAATIAEGVRMVTAYLEGHAASPTAGVRR